MTETYEIHDNGGRPWRVVIKDNNVSVYSNARNATEEPILNFDNVLQIFIGKCSVEGPNFDGNTILLNIKSNEYVYFQREIYSFKSFAKIIKYSSPVGNNDVPYPFARDTENNCYLMLEGIAYDKIPEKCDDVYNYYWDEPKSGLDIKVKDKNGTQFGLYYKQDPESYFNMFKDSNNNMNIIDENGKEKSITFAEYVPLSLEIANSMGIKPFQDKVVLGKEISA